MAAHFVEPKDNTDSLTHSQDSPNKPKQRIVNFLSPSSKKAIIFFLLYILEIPITLLAMYIDTFNKYTGYLFVLFIFALYKPFYLLFNYLLKIQSPLFNFLNLIWLYLIASLLSNLIKIQISPKWQLVLKKINIGLFLILIFFILFPYLYLLPTKATSKNYVQPIN